MVSSANASQKAGATFELWNRRLHFHGGLFLLFYLWLFALTGLLLNHPQWKFADFWPTRKQSSYERPISAPPPGSDLDQARNLLVQLGLRGEIEWTSARADSRRLDFSVGRPGHMTMIKADFVRGRASVRQIDVNGWGEFRILHTFAGERAGDALNQRDWIMTTVWAFSMDAVAAGVLIMVLGSYFMWWRLPKKRMWGAVALLSGWMVAGWFLFGLRIFF
jgi:hypothetical protein